MVFWFVNMTDLEKRAEQIRKELSIEDKTNLVAKAIIELVKEKEDFICFQDISFKIQDYFLLPHCKPYVIHCSGSSDGAGASLPYYLKKLCNIDLYLNNLKPIYLVIGLKGKNGINFKTLFDFFCKYYKSENIIEYNGDYEKDQKETLKKIINGDYDFLLKPISILDKIKVEKSIDEETENIKDENEKKNTRELGKEQTVYARASFPLEEINKIHKRAQNKCEYCECQTFEKKNGEMYFEIHHIVHYSDGGENSAQNCVLLCPNCHRKIHFAKEEIVNEMERTLKRKVKNNLLSI